MNMILRILMEAEAAGREGEDFYRWWLDSVCRRRNRQSFIRGDVFDQARAAWERGRATVEHEPRPEPEGRRGNSPSRRT